ncbi:ATP-binding protein [Salidesulfovibrio brasiliensis]|uniref:ATP-binding protein n=1 Tax=Salidesulfovibrio brasiliensis TaxID=221711 RepID=UPI0006CF727A|nr:ATP-binding protein [Salidesulfovibrio brasiliensis]
MKQLVVISGKGGTGKTSITAALAALAQNAVLADCDVDAADLHLLLHPTILEKEDFYSGETPTMDPVECISCGVCAEHCRFDAIDDNFQPIKENCEGCGVCEYVCPTDAVTMHPRKCGVKMVSKTRYGTMVHAELGIGEENSGKLVTDVRRTSAEIAEREGAEYVIVDGSPGVGCPVIASLTGADACLLVAEPTVSALHDLGRVVELLTHFKLPSYCVINKRGVNPELEERIATFCRERNVQIAGSLDYDKAFNEAQAAGQTIVEYDPDGLGRQVTEIWNATREFLL